MEYKLFNTDGKTFFDFRSNPGSRCEGFTVSYLDDGTVVMSGDYGTLCWKRYGNSPDYGFPGEGTGMRYFEEKVCQWGVKQKVKEFNMEHAIEQLEEYTDKDNEEEVKRMESVKDDLRFSEDWEEHKFWEAISEHYDDHELCDIGERYTSQFKSMFNKLCSVSDKITDAVEKHDVKQKDNEVKKNNEN